MTVTYLLLYAIALIDLTALVSDKRHSEEDMRI